MRYFLTLFGIAWKTIAIATALVSIASFWPTIKGLPSQYGYKWGEIIPERETILWVFLVALLFWLVWVDIGPHIIDQFKAKHPLKLDHAPGLGWSEDPHAFHISISNTSKSETIEDVSVFLASVQHIGTVRSALSPDAGDYLLFIDGSTKQTLRPDETGILQYMSTPNGVKDGKIAIEVGPFAHKMKSNWHNFQAFQFDFIIHCKGYPASKQSIWCQCFVNESQNGSTMQFGLGKPSDAELKRSDA